MRVGFLGTGVIASAVVEGIAGDGHQIIVSTRSAQHSQRLADAFPSVSVAENAEVVANSDVIFLGLMAEAAPAILSGLPFRSDQQVISMMAGASLEQVAELVAPASAAAVMMPFPGIARGNSPIMALGDMDLLNQIFGANNHVFALENDAELDAYLSAQAVLSPAVKLVSEAADWLSPQVSDPEQAETFLRVLVGSSLLDSQCKPLLDALNTPGGYNQRLRQHMENSGMGVALQEGLNRISGND